MPPRSRLRRRKRTPLDPGIHAAIQAMVSNCDEPLTASSLAARAGLSASRFKHLFRSEVGRPFSRALREFRLARAAALLDDRSLRIKEVAARCGYSDGASFTHVFRKQFDNTPSSYRRSIIGQGIAPKGKGTSLT